MNVNEILNDFPRDAAKLIDILHAVQQSSDQNYISEEAVIEIAAYLKISKAKVYGVISYYSMLSIKPRGKHIIRCCQSPVCFSKGSKELICQFEKELSIKIGETTADKLFTLETCECLGRCGKAPSVMVDKEAIVQMNEDKMKNVIKAIRDSEGKIM